MKREELKLYRGSWECLPDDVYDKEEADAVMDAMEARIKELEKAKRDILTRNVELIGENAQLTMKIKELEEENKHLDDYIDAYQKSEALNIEKLDKKDERIKELEEQCTKYQAELMNNDPALNYMPPTTEEK